MSARRQFTRAVLRDIEALEHLLNEGMIETGIRRIGAEQEMFLVDRAWRPAHVALELIDAVDDPHFVTEVGAFNLEMNLDPQTFSGDCFAHMERQLDDLLGALRRVANERSIAPVLVGILPTIRKSDLGLAAMVDKPRYHALNAAISAMRGNDVDLFIKGIDELRIRHDSVMVEACNASFQVHLQVEPDEFPNAYNCAQVLAGPVLASATNSPMLFGLRLWAETRIAVFQQAVDTRRLSHHLRNTQPRVTFGDGWVRNSILDLYRDDIARFAPLLPDEEFPDPFEQLERGEVPTLGALRLHTGTVWRWNRGCYGVGDGKPHLRIENRVLPSGPTPVDEVANAALWLGAMVALQARHDDVTTVTEFEHARWNFVAAARDGLTAPMVWLGGREMLASQLVLDEILPLAHEGLTAVGVDDAERDRYLGIVERRVRSGNTGSRWIVHSLAAMRDHGTPGQRLSSITAGIVARQEVGTPVADWSLAQVDEGGAWQSDMRRVEHVMSTEFHTVHPEDPISLVASLMDWHHLRHVMVEDNDGKFVGTVSYRAIVKLMTASTPVDAGAVSVADVMESDPACVGPDMDVARAVQVMRSYNLAAVPVVYDGQLVGILSEQQFITFATELLLRELGAAPPA